MRFLAALFLAGATLPASAQVLSGRRAPSFSLPDSALVQHDILDYRGKWLLVDFMKTDCPHCMVLSKLLEQIKTQFAGKVEVLSVLMAPPETTSTAARYALDTKVTSPFVFDQGQVAAAYFKATPSRPGFDTPHLFVINPAGTIVRDWGDNEGTREIMEGPGLARELASLMAGTAKTAPAPAK